MNNKGFAITGFIYTIFILFIVLMITILTLLNSRKTLLDNLKKTVMLDVNNTKVIEKIEPYTKVNKEELFIPYISDYYEFILESPKYENIKGTRISFNIYVSIDDKIYIYNDGKVITIKDKNKKVIAKASYNVNDNFIDEQYLDGLIFDSFKEENVIDKTGSVSIERMESKSGNRKNINLNGVRYIKDCINGNEFNNDNIWTEIRAYMGNYNVMSNNDVKIFLIGDNTDELDNKLVNDNDLNTFIKSQQQGKQCIKVDLGGRYNLDAISVFHKENTLFYEDRIYVAQMDKESDYILVRNLDEKETSRGLVVSAFDEPLIRKVGDVYVPVKEYLGAKWLRVFHHNNKRGTVFWSSSLEAHTPTGRDTEFKQSILYFLEQYKNSDNKYEFLLEYSDINDYIRWIQPSSLTVPTNNNIEKIHCPFDNFYGLYALETKSYLASYLSNSVNQYYFIGFVDLNENIDSIVVDGTHTTKEITDLWVRIDEVQ